MTILYFVLIFLTIVLLLAFRRPLQLALLGGLVLSAVLYRFSPLTVAELVSRVFTQWSSLSVIITLYLITFLQQMLEAKQLIKRSGEDLDGLFHNRRVNATLAPLFIGLLPSAAAMLLCGQIVKDASGDRLKPQEQAFVTHWFRHIPECLLPTYSGVLLICTLGEVQIGHFMLGMIPPAIVLAILGFFPYLPRIPKDPGTPVSTNRKKDFLHLLCHLWPILLTLLLILGFDLSVVPAVAISLAATALVYRFSPAELWGMAKKAFDLKLISNTFLVLVLKEFISHSGVLEELPQVMALLPVPLWLVFAVLFFCGTIVNGATGMVAMCTSLAVASVGGGMPLVVLLMCSCHAASQLSPTHICLVVASEYFHVSFGTLVRKILPRSLLFFLFALGYYNLLLLLGV